MNSFNKFINYINLLLNSATSLFLSGCFCGLIIFLYLFGLECLNPTNDNWLMAYQDLSSHYLGWIAYRAEDWKFPLCITDNLSYPIFTSILYTDSIPIFAVFFKLCSPFISQTFQYFGLFGLISFMLQGGFSAIFFKILKCQNIIAVIGSAIASYFPILTQRLFEHTSLSSHWLIIVALILLKYDLNIKNKIIKYLYWNGLLFISIGIHFYFTIMILIIFLSYNFGRLIDGITLTKEILISILISLISIITSIFIFGGFVGNTRFPAGYTDDHGANINAWIDSKGWSRLLPESEFTLSNYQANAYLGLGIIIICLFIIFLFSKKFITYILSSFINNKNNINVSFFNIIKFSKKYYLQISLFICFIFSFVLSLGINAKFYNYNIYNLKFLPSEILISWGIIRATFRFIWIPSYIILFFSISFIIQYFRRFNVKLLVIVLIFVLQIVDINSFSKIFKPKLDFNNDLQNSIWGELTGYSHIYFNFEPKYEQFISTSNLIKYALLNNMTVNRFYFARTPKGVPYPFSLENDTLYIFKHDWPPYASFKHDNPNKSLKLSISKKFNNNCISDYVIFECSAYLIDDFYVTASKNTTGNFFSLIHNIPKIHFDNKSIIYPTSSGVLLFNGNIINNIFYTNGKPGLVMKGPDWNAKEGIFDLKLNYKVIENFENLEQIGEISVYTHWPFYILNTTNIISTQSNLSINNITFTDLNDVFGIMIYQKENIKLRIESIEVFKH